MSMAEIERKKVSLLLYHLIYNYREKDNKVNNTIALCGKYMLFYLHSLLR